MYSAYLRGMHLDLTLIIYRSCFYMGLGQGAYLVVEEGGVVVDEVVEVVEFALEVGIETLLEALEVGGLLD